MAGWKAAGCLANPMTPAAEAFAWRLRGHLYRRIRDTGTVPSRAELAAGLAAADTEIDRALRFLVDACVLALDERGEVWMAHPFSAVPTPYRVETPSGAYWANCAWDALAIPLLLGTDGRTRASCPQSGTRFDLTITRGRAGPRGAVVRLAVPVRDFWDDIGFT
ncbi:MAG: organomercurial lyase [Gemmatimonadota bacterium]|nr:organomercurial lyase [Gemmatimonadota bacterium]